MERELAFDEAMAALRAGRRVALCGLRLEVGGRWVEISPEQFDVVWDAMREMRL